MTNTPKNSMQEHQARIVQAHTSAKNPSPDKKPVKPKPKRKKK
jgi:hypothetical protein